MVLAAVIAGGLVVAAGVAVLLANIVHLRATADRTIRSDAYLVATMDVEKVVVDAETGLRGYVITRNPRFLQPLRAARGQIGPTTAALQRAARAEGAFVARAMALDTAARAYLAVYVPRVLDEMRRDPATARSLATTLTGKHQVDAIRAQTLQLERLVSARLDARQRAAHSSADHAVMLAIAMLVGLTALTILLGALLARLFQSRERAREHAAFLANAGAQLDRQLTGEDVLREFARLTRERGVELCVAEESAPGDGSREQLSPGAPEADAGLRAATASSQAAAAADRARAGADEHGTTWAEQLTMGSGPEQVQVLALAAVAREVAVVSAFLARRGKPWQPDEIAEMAGLGTRLALALHARRLQAETATLYRRSELTVRTLQRSLVPRVLPEIPGCELAVRFTPATRGALVGGDFYDAFAVGRDQWAVVVGDVCGKGAGAAAVTAMVRWTLRNLAETSLSPAEMLRRLNAAMLQQDLDRRYITVAYALVKLSGQAAEVRLACAGHPPPILVDPDGEPFTVDAHGDLLGVWDGVEIHEETVALAPGSTVLLYTDGVTDQGPGSAQPLEVVLRELRAGASASELATELERHAHRQNVDPRDDIAIVALRFEGNAGGEGGEPAGRAAGTSGGVLGYGGQRLDALDPART
jgi:serine phosphatase RsbU (regulator of sigma subunit)/CHASE3 domain sensor protein